MHFADINYTSSSLDSCLVDLELQHSKLHWCSLLYVILFIIYQTNPLDLTVSAQKKTCGYLLSHNYSG